MRKPEEARASGTYEDVRNTGPARSPSFRLKGKSTALPPHPEFELTRTREADLKKATAQALQGNIPVRPERRHRRPAAPEPRVGMLQIAEAHSLRENPILNGQAFDERQRQQATPPTPLRSAYQSTGGDAVLREVAGASRRYARPPRVSVRSSTQDVSGGAWRDVHRHPRRLRRDVAGPHRR